MAEISVVIPNYNYDNYLQLRIDSVINQTFQDFEIIILDDSSNDNSRSIIEKYRNHPKLTKIIFNDENSGSPFKQWNKGIKYANGKWIWIAEADDFANEYYLERMINSIQNDADVVLSYCQSFKINSDGEITGDWTDWTSDLDKITFENDFILPGNIYIKKFLLKKNTIPNASAVIFRKDIFENIGEAETTIPYCADWLLWLKILTMGNIAFCADKLNYFRYHNNSVIATARESLNFQDIYKYEILLRKKYINFLKNRVDIIHKTNKFDELLKLVKASHSHNCEINAKYLKDHGKNKKSIYYMILALKHSNNKKKVIYRLLKIYIFSFKQNIH